MFFVFPVRSESRVRRFPAVTVSLIILNVLVFLFSYPAMKRNARIISLKLQVLEDVEDRIVAANAKIKEDFSDILVYAKPDKRLLLREKIKNKEISMPDHLWKEWKQAYDEVEEAWNESIIMKYGFVSTDFDISTLITSMFLHVGFLHLFGNMWFLWLVGLNVEDDWGRPFFLGFYIFSGIVATLIFTAVTEGTAVLIGASGAIAGVMGAFAVQYYKSKIYFMFFPFIYRLFPLYAWFYLPLWFLTQLYYAVYLPNYSNTAFWAHVGGFGFGVAVVAFLRISGLERKYLKPLVADTLNMVDSDFSKAVEARSTGDIEKAEKHLKEILVNEPANLDAAEELIDIYIKEGRKEEANLVAKETFRMLRMEKKDPSIIINFYEEVLERKGLISNLSPYDFYFISQIYGKREQKKEAARVLAIAYKEHRDTNDAPYILLRLIKALAQSGNQKFLKKALFELQKKFPEIKNKAISILREVKNEKK